jgi:hypothetical protein
MTTQYDPTPPRASPRSNAWQDWANLVLAIWLFISPWVLQFGAGVQTATPQATVPGGPVGAVSNAAWNAWVLGVIIGLVALSAIGRLELWQEWVNLLLGIWVFIAPWVLGFAGAQTQAAAWDHWIVGFLVFIISISNLGRARRVTPPSAVDYAAAGSKPVDRRTP